MKNFLLLAGSIGYAATAFAQAKQPNIVLILADDMRGSAPAFLGIDATITPNLDKFSHDATTFTNAYIMGGSSGAVSKPSRAMLMTGKYLHTLENRGAVIPDDHTTIGEVLQSKNYTTYHTGKWHNGPAGFNRCFQNGEAIFFGGMADQWNVPLYHYHEDGQYTKNRPVTISPSSSNKLKYESGDYVLSGSHTVEIFSGQAVEFIENHNNDEQPFFLSVAFMTPHDPRTTHQRFFDMYNTEDIKVPASFMPEHPFDNGELKIRDEKLLPFPRTEEGVKRMIADYYALISHTDEGVGRIIDALKEQGLYENTIIIFAADNGLSVGQHGLLGKQNVYEQSVKIPLMIKDVEGKQAGEVRDEQCLLIDLFPTLCDYVGADVPESVDGVSLMPILKDGKKTRDYLYFGYVDEQRAVSDGEWKLIEYCVEGVRTTQLFNIEKDPEEINDLSKERKYAKLIKKLREQMKVEHDRTSDIADFITTL